MSVYPQLPFNLTERVLTPQISRVMGHPQAKTAEKATGAPPRKKTGKTKSAIPTPQARISRRDFGISSELYGIVRRKKDRISSFGLFIRSVLFSGTLCAIQVKIPRGNVFEPSEIELVFGSDLGYKHRQIEHILISVIK